MKEISNKRLGTKFTAYEFEYLCKQVQKTFIESKEFSSLIKRKKEALMKADWEGFITQIYNSQEDGIDERPAQQFAKSIINVLNKETDDIDDIGTITFADIIEEYVEETKKIVTSEKAKTIISSKLAKYLKNRRTQDYVQARDNNKLISFGRGKKKEDKYTGIIFLRYVGHTSFDDLKEKAALIKGEIDKIINAETEVYESLGDTKNFQTDTDLRFFKKFYLIGLRLSEKRIVRHEIWIDFENRSLRMISEKGKSYEKGTFTFKKGFIQITVDRESETERTWIPFTAYFQWDRPLQDFRGAIGTYSGVAFNKERAIGGYAVLVLQEDYNKEDSTLALDIERYLYLEIHGIDVIASPNLEKALRPVDIDSIQLESFIGVHEIWDLGKYVGEGLSVYQLEIKENFFSIIQSPSEGYEYIVRLRSEGETLLMHVSANRVRKHARDTVFTNCAVINKKTPLYAKGKIKVYSGACCGISRNNNDEYFPILLVTNPPNPLKQKYDLTEIKEGFLQDKERIELNKFILKKLVELEKERLSYTQPIIDKILPLIE